MNKTIVSYNATAIVYAEAVKGFLLQEKMDYFLNRLPENAKILDLGCGSGRDAKIFSEQGYRVTGVDLSERLLEIAQDEAPDAKFKLMDIRELNFKKQSFDGLWAVASLLHIPKKEMNQTLKGCYNVLKPNGIIYLAMKKGTTEGYEFDERYGVEKYWSYYLRKDLVNLLKKNNFDIISSYVEEKDTSYATHPWVNIFCKKY